MFLAEYGDVTDIYNWCFFLHLRIYIYINKAFEYKWDRQGSSNVHCSDTFNENSPPTSDPEFISSLGSAVYKAMSKADKDAVWLMQVGSPVMLNC